MCRTCEHGTMPSVPDQCDLVGVVVTRLCDGRMRSLACMRGVDLRRLHGLTWPIHGPKMLPGAMPWATTVQASDSHAQDRVNLSGECHERSHMSNLLCLNPLI